ncbi:hypothetical protein [Rhizobium sp. NZLR4b]|uniref:hypothetical protein n=1 Tax=Rhizobium sp. NZLR4b TaxID=2731102 RepID=UPI001C831D8B|nr:hypothetical protein [Rhizobium sp. NZLR4b]MBX5164773.1 hypothetical protein [Rhizobium sp. NZLR4b]
MSAAGLSPHYFIKWNRGYQPSRSEEEPAVRRAHQAVCYLASLDLDHAQIANNAGFSKSDVTRGHNLAKWPEDLVVKLFALSALAVLLAQKYDRQLPPSLKVKPPVQAAFDV